MKYCFMFFACFLAVLSAEKPVVGIVSGHPLENQGIVTSIDSGYVVERVGGRDYHRATIGETEVILVGSFPGKVSAASSATCLIERFGVDVLFSVGTTGAIDPTLEVGDFVIGTSVVQHDVDSRPFIAQYEIPFVKQIEFKSDVDLVEKAKRFLPSRTGLIATGDQFIDHPEKKEELRGAFADLLVVDMEAGAVAQVAYMYDKPFLAVKVVSCSCEPGSKEQVQQFVKEQFPQKMSGFLKGFLN